MSKVCDATQEIFDNGLDIDPETVVHVWKWWWPVSGAAALASQQLQHSTTNTTTSSSSSSGGGSALSGDDRSAVEGRGGGGGVGGGAAAGGRPRVCQLARGCVPARAELEAEVAPGWTNAIAGVTQKVLHVFPISACLVHVA